MITLSPLPQRTTNTSNNISIITATDYDPISCLSSPIFWHHSSPLDSLCRRFMPQLARPPHVFLSGERKPPGTAAPLYPTPPLSSHPFSQSVSTPRPVPSPCLSSSHTPGLKEHGRVQPHVNPIHSTLNTANEATNKSPGVPGEPVVA